MLCLYCLVDRDDGDEEEEIEAEVAGNLEDEAMDETK